MLSIMNNLRGRMAVAFLAAGVAFGVLSLQASSAFAAADPTTGIDYDAIGTDTLASAKPAVVAGVAILVLITAVTLGKKLWRKVSN